MKTATGNLSCISTVSEKLGFIGKSQDIVRSVGNNNKTAGSIFEEEFAQMLKSRGFWVHRMAQSAEGQPADIIAQRNGCVWLIDCKVCACDRFPLNRVEYNQHLSMQAWMSAGGTVPYFALLLSDGTVRMLSFPDILKLESMDIKSISVTSGSIDDNTCSLDNWITAVKLWEVKHSANDTHRGRSTN